MPLTSPSASATSADSGPRHRRRRGRLLPLISAGITAVLALAGVVAISSPAVADDPVTGEISGLVNVQVAAPAFFDPANDTTDVVQVHAYRLTGTTSHPTLTSEGFTSTHGDGTWSFDSLPVGKYAFDFEYHGTRTNLIAHVFDRGAYTQEEVLAHPSTNTTAIGDGESHVVDDGYVSAGADLFTLVTGASVPLDGQPVTLWREGTDIQSGATYWPEDDPWAELTTSGGGNANFGNLPPGNYTMRAGDGSGGWVPQFYDGDEGTTRPQDADVINVGPATGTPIAIDLEQGGKVSGTVTNTAGMKLAGVEVTAYALDSEDNWHAYSAPATTAANGTYTLGGLPTGVDLTLYFEAASYLPQYWKGASSAFDATPFSLTSATTKPGFSVKLTKGASISGVLTAGGPTVHPGSDDVVISACKNLPGGSQPDCLELEDPPGYGHVAYDSGTGAYSITGLAAGTYTVQVQYVGDGNFRNEFFSDKRSAATATTFAVGTGASVTGKNIQLDAGAVLFGNVHHGVDPIPGATVTVYPASEYYYDEANFVDSAVTGPDGNYFVTGLEQGDYIILVTPPEDSDLAQQWYGGQTLHDYATPLHVDAFSSFGPYDVDLQATGRFHGTITDYLGDPVSNAQVTLYRYVTPGSYRAVDVDFTFTDLSGDYSFEDVPPGQYTLFAEGGGSPAGSGFLGRYNGAASEAGIASATRTFMTEHDDSFISFSLDLGGRYIGRVTDGTDPIPGADVITDGSGTNTQGDGTFTLTGLSQGPHTVTVDASAVTDEVVSTRDVSAPAVSWNAPPVDLGDIALEAPSTLNGLLLGSGGKPVKYALIGAFTVDEQQDPVLVGLTVADSKGRFTIGDLPSEPVYLYIPSAGTKYADQWAGGGSEWAQSTPVDFDDPGTKFREVRLISGSTITGTVKNASTGKGIKNLAIGIARLDAQGTIVGYQLVPTNSKGVYTAHGLDAGSYTVFFNEFGLGAGDSFNIDEKTVYVADRTTVKVNATLSGAPSVSGIVTGASGPLDDVDVTVYDATGSLVNEGDSETSTDNLGRYTLHLQPGTYRLFFSDPQRRVASSFLGGGTTFATATPVVVAKKSLTGRNIVLGAAGGSFRAVVQGDAEPDPEGYMQLEYLTGGDVQASEWVYGDHEFSELSTQLPIRNLAAGDYRVTFYGYSRATEFGGQYALDSVDFSVTDGLETDIGTVTLTGLDPYEGDDFPQVISGSEPTINYAPSPRVGDMLTTSSGSWSPSPDQYFYQWLRNGKPIPGANDEFYLLQPADAGASISLKMGASSVDFPGPNYSTLVKMDDLIGAAPAPSQVDPAAILGDARVGATVTAQPGDWDTEGLSFTYQWYRDNSGNPIDGATNVTYKPVLADVGSTLGVLITSHRTGYAEAVVDIPMVGSVLPAAAVKLVTAPKVTDTGDGWKVSTGTWSPSGTNVTWEFRKYDPDGDSYSTYLGEVATPNELHDAGLHDGVGRFTVVVTATRASYRPTSVEIDLNKGPAAFYDVEPTVLSGTPTVGLPVEFDFGSGLTVPTNTSHSYQWFRGATKITGATAALYTPKLSDEGFALSLVVTLKAPGYATGTATLAVPGTVAGAPPITAGTTGFSGDAIIGRPLTVTTSGWTPEPTGYTYTWFRDGVLIPGVTKATYTPIFADETHVLSVDVVGMRSGHANSAPEHITTDPVISLPLQSLAPPSIPTIVHPGVKITVNTGVWDLAPKSFSYQWFVNSAPIAGATGPSFTPRVEDVGETLHVVVNAFRSGVDGSGDIESTVGYVDPGAAVKATKPPKLTVAGKTVKSLKLGQTVAATTGSWPTAALELTYQWQVDDGGGSFRDIDGATYPTLFLDSTSSDFGVTFRYRVKVTGTRSGYLDSVAISSVLTIVS